MNWLPFSQKPALKVEVALDIGSKSAGGVIFSKGPDGKAKLLYTTREKITFQKTLTGENLSTAMLKALDLVLFHLEKYGIEHLQQSGVRYSVGNISTTISSPWHASETKTLTLKFDSPSLVTETVVRELLGEEEKSFEEQFGGGGSGALTFEVLECKIIEMRLNGYPTAKPYGKKAKELEIQMFGSIIPARTLQTIENFIGKRFPESRLEFHTFSATAFASIRDLFPELDSFLLVQVGGEVSDVTIVKKGILVETESFPFGHNNLLRTLAKMCRNYPHCTLESLFKLHQEIGIQTADQKRVEAALAETKTSWLEHFNTAISNFSEETFLPKTLFLFEESPYSILFKDFLREAESSQFTVTAEPFIVKVVDRAMISPLAEFDKNALPDEVLAMEAGFISRLRN